MVNAITTPVRERPLGPLDDNKQVRSPQAVKPTLQPARQTNPPRGQEKRKKTKPSQLCLTPPSLIEGGVGHSYQRGLCIGEGGFARCFQVKNGNGEVFAAKTLAKAALRNEKTKAKLITEIDIHRSMDHPNIVKFMDCFEDDVNVYVLLEICSNQSLADMVHRRRHLTEPEARFFFVQMLGATGYMHTRGVIHRDLKLGNVFIDKNMDLKVGDFGLAAILENRRSRRYTVCGTPNYIAPEVLHRPHAHDSATDIWALGIILYSMLVGRPPFQDKVVDNIYARIKRHELCFPPVPSPSLQDAWDLVSPEARELISHMIHPDPAMRPDFRQCLNHEWVRMGTFVSSVPQRALTDTVYLHSSPQESLSNLAQAVTNTKLDTLVHVRWPVDVPSTTSPMANGSAAGPISNVQTIGNVAVGKVLPHHISPPSTRDKYKPVVVSNPQTETGQNVPDYDSPVVGRSGKPARDIQNTHSPGVGRQQQQPMRMQFPVTAARTSTDAAEALKNRLFSGLSSAINSSSNMAASRPISNGPPRLLQRPTSTTHRNVIEPLRSSIKLSLSNIRQAIAPGASQADLPASMKGSVDPPTLVSRWADFDESWGLSYCLSDGSVAILFRDRSTMRMDPFFRTYVYFESKSRPGYVTMHRTAEDTNDPKRLKKVQVLDYVRNYMDRELAHAVEPSRSGGDVSNGEVLHFIKKHREYIMFVFTDGSVQFNFKDHIKVILYDNGTKIGLITETRQLFSWTIDNAVRTTRATHFARVDLVTKLIAIHGALKDYIKKL